jgi:predicted P-loop ATPase
MVIDYDPRKDVVSGQGLARLTTQYGIDITQTFVVQSGSSVDSLHIYLRKPDTAHICKRHEDHVAIDFLSKGAYVVGPGSIHAKTGLPYSVRYGSLDNLLDAPEALLDALAKQTDINEVFGVDHWSDDTQSIERFKVALTTHGPALQGGGGDAHTVMAALFGRDIGLHPKTTLQVMLNEWNPLCEPPWTPHDLKVKVANAYKYAKRPAGTASPRAAFQDTWSTEEIREHRIEAERAAKQIRLTTSNGKLKDHPVNVVACFRIPPFRSFKNPLYKLLKYNMFSGHIEFTRPAPWHNRLDRRVTWSKAVDAVICRQYLYEEWGMEVGLSSTQEGIVRIAVENQYHPVWNYFESVQWDGINRIEHLFSRYAGAEDSAYSREVSRSLMLSVVARVFKPGSKVDTMVVMEGKQGTGKSTFCRTLAVQSEWFMEGNLDPQDKNTTGSMQGKILIEFPEMEFMSKRDAASIKAFLSKQVDNARLPYGSEWQDFPRQCVFISTTNPDATNTYLNDPTGNRRFLPIETTAIDVPQLRKDLDLLWAEAVHRYRQGEPHHFYGYEAERTAMQMQTDRQIVDEWDGIISEWIHGLRKSGLAVNELTLGYVSENALGISAARLKRLETVRLVATMARLGYAKVQNRGLSGRGHAFIRDIVEVDIEALTQDL